MVVDNGFVLPATVGVIFIDCWESYYSNVIFKKIVQSLDQSIPTIPAKIFATYNYNLRKADPSFFNSLEFFYKKGRAQDFAQSIIDERITTSYSDSGSGQLSYIFEKYVDHNAFLINNIPLFKSLVNFQFSNVKDWLVIGGSWNHCYHKRPMGVIQLFKEFNNTDYNFYSATWAAVPYNSRDTITHDSFVNDSLVWDYNGSFYRLSKSNEFSQNA